MPINERLKNAIDSIKFRFKLKQSEIAEQLGVKSTYLSDMINGRVPLSDSMKEKIYESFSYNIDEQNHLLKETLSYADNDINKIFASEPTISYERKIKNESELNRGVPFYNVDVSLGFKETFESKEIAEYYVDYKPFNDCTAYLPVYGDSMFPKFRNGEVIAVKRIFNFDVILWGEAYLIITNDNANNLRTVKLLFEHEEISKIILRASNPNYPGDTVINKDDIIALYSVRGKISRDFI